MVRITRVYTRMGDDGQTSLAGGIKIEKDHSRIESLGCLDELNSLLGVCCSFLQQKEQSPEREQLQTILEAIQQKLFDMGAELATLPGKGYPGQVKTVSEDVLWLETMIDAMNKNLSSLQSFILPGGTPLNAFLHQARTVCRRTERQVIRFSREDAVNAELLKYLNRLSDFLFVACRWVTAHLQETEILWVAGKQRPVWNLSDSQRSV